MLEKRGEIGRSAVRGRREAAQQLIKTQQSEREPEGGKKERSTQVDKQVRGRRKAEELTGDDGHRKDKRECPGGD